MSARKAHPGAQRQARLDKIERRRQLRVPDSLEAVAADDPQKVQVDGSTVGPVLAKAPRTTPAQLRAAHQLLADRTHPHSWLTMLPLALLTGAMAVGASHLSIAATTWGLVLTAAGIGGAGVLVGLLTVATADLVLGGRGVKELTSWLRSTEDARAVIVFNALLGVGLVALIRLAYPLDQMPYPAILAIVLLAAVWRSLSLAYRHQYLDRTLSSNQRLYLDAERIERPRWQRVLFWAFGARALQERHRLILPSLQSLIVLLVPQLSLIFYIPLSATDFSQGLALVLFPVTLVLSIWAWGRWHLFGGLGSVLAQVVGLDTGRPLRPQLTEVSTTT